MKTTLRKLSPISLVAGGFKWIGEPVGPSAATVDSKINRLIDAQLCVQRYPRSTLVGENLTDQMRGSSLLRSMRVILHVSFATLLLVAVVRSTMGVSPIKNMHVGMILVLGVLLGSTYFAGTFIEKRRSDRGDNVAPALARWWLAGVTLLWLVLLAGNAEFSWLAFPLFFVHFTVLPAAWGALTTITMTVAVVAVQLTQSSSPQAAMILGPFFGIAFAWAFTWVYRELLADLTRQRALVDELRQTRQDLAISQHEAGVIAERERMAREIHDTLAQGLSSIILVSRAARTALAAGDTQLAEERLEVVEHAASENLTQARDFVRAVTSEPAQQGQDSSTVLGVNLEKLCARIQDQMRAAGADATVTFVSDGDPRPLPSAVALGLMRVAQTLLGNVAAHSGALTCVVTLTSFPDAVSLDVYDSGRGFSPDTELLDASPTVRSDGSGYGLRSATQRVNALGGTIEIASQSDASQPDRGTLVSVLIPLGENNLNSDS